MISNSPTVLVDPIPADWLNSFRIRYLNDSILPLYPLLLESNLLDRVLIAWFKHEILFEVNPSQNSELDQESLLLQWCRQQWGHRLESLYLANKSKLDLVSYRILTVKTSHLAYELYYRLKANEETFDRLCMDYSVGDEKFKGGKFTGIPLSTFPAAMQTAFTSMQVGDLHKPLKFGDNFVVLELLNCQSASFNDQSERNLLLLQLKDWQQGMIEAVREHLE